MALTDFQYARTANQGVGDEVFKNTHASTDIAAGDVVTIDTTHIMSGTQPVVGINQATTDNQPIGVAVDAIPVGKTGRVATLGIIQTKCSAAVTVGDVVQASTSGKVKTTAGAKPQVGVALMTTTTDGDPLLVQLQLGAKNA